MIGSSRSPRRRPHAIGLPHFNSEGLIVATVNDDANTLDERFVPYS